MTKKNGRKEEEKGQWLGQSNEWSSGGRPKVEMEEAVTVRIKGKEIKERELELKRARESESETIGSKCLQRHRRGRGRGDNYLALAWDVGVYQAANGLGYWF
ncbi:hypothetical protein ACLOJK_018547 [Asimina triloba]